MRARILSIALICAATTTARADDEWPLATSFGRLSISVGSRDLGSATTSVAQLAVAGGYQGTAYALYGEGRFGRQTDGKEDQLSALASSLAVHVRRTVARIAEKDGVISTWVDAGFGVQHMQWSDGSLARPVASLGFGGGIDLRSVTGRWVGVSVELRLEVSPSIAWDRELARCTAGCAMRTDAYDLGVAFLGHFPFSLGEPQRYTMRKR